jgi:hypothetical protein
LQFREFCLDQFHLQRPCMFEFYFQRGEFIPDSFGWWKDFFVPILTVFIPVGIVFLQQYLERQKAASARRNEIDERLKYISILVHASMGYAAELIMDLQNLDQYLGTNRGRLEAHVSDSNSVDLDRVTDRIDQAVYFNAYIEKFPGKHSDIRAIFSGLDQIKQIRDNLYQSASPFDVQYGFSLPTIENSYSKLTSHLQVIRDSNQAPEDIISRFEALTDGVRNINGGWLTNPVKSSFFTNIHQLCIEMKGQGRNAFNQMFDISHRGKDEINTLAHLVEDFKSEARDWVVQLPGIYNGIVTRLSDLSQFYTPEDLSIEVLQEDI